MQIWSHWPSPAKINLFLRIVGRRSDGYHNLQTVFQLLDWGDVVRIRARSDDEIINHSSASYGVQSAQDITVRAAIALKPFAKIPFGVDIEIDKIIPTGGGFGGGSSNAATVLHALNTLWHCELSNEHLRGIGQSLGADVPVFVLGQNAWAEGIGEQLTPIYLPEAWFLLIDSGVHVPTAELFQSPQLTREQKLVKIAGYVSGSLLENAFEPVLRQSQTRINHVFECMAGFGKVALTGSGGGCFMRFASEVEAKYAQNNLPDGYRSWVVKSAPESTLLQAVLQVNGSLT